jgi:hypothetical protein
MEIVTWTTGKPGKDEIETEAIKAQSKVAQWYTPRYAERALATIRRHAVDVFKTI